MTGSWLSGARLPWARPRPREVVIVTRDGCHLCTEMLAVVGEAAGGLPVTVLDLDQALADGALSAGQHARWTTEVPVLLVDGDEVAHHRVTPADARRAIRGDRRRFGG